MKGLVGGTEMIGGWWWALVHCLFGPQKNGHVGSAGAQLCRASRRLATILVPGWFTVISHGELR